MKRSRSKGRSAKPPRKYQRGTDRWNQQVKNAMSLNRGTVVIREPNGIPTDLDVKLKYIDGYTLASGATAFSQIWRLNGPYDPDYTGTGHQPYLFDQYMAMYNVYCVRGCKVKVSVTPQQTNSGVGTIFYGFTISDNLPDTTLAPLVNAEKQYGQYRLHNADDRPEIFKAYRNIGVLYGMGKDGHIKDSTFWGDASSNPTNQAFAMLQGVTATGGTSTNHNVIVELTYYVRFQKQKRVAAS